MSYKELLMNKCPRRIAGNAAIAIGLMLSGLVAPVFAGTSVLGYELNATTSEQFKSSPPKKVNLVDQGTNSISHGPQFRVDGAPYDLEGLNNVTVVFDDQRKLAGVFMVMDKGKFDTVYDAIAKKYKLVEQQRPFVGNRYAKFISPDAVIEINAPHLSFEMLVQYLRTDFSKNIQATAEANSAAKKKREADKF